MEIIENVLASRYASAPMRAIWSAGGRIILEREFWIAVMKAQRGLGLDIPEEVIAAYESVKNAVNLDSIRERERLSRHDVKARIEEFCALAGYEHIHKGLTSRDLTENVEQLQIYRSLLLVRDKSVSVLKVLAGRAAEYADTVITARTHNVAAQPTTMGKRLAMFGEEFYQAFISLDELISRYPVRGIKGAVGTQVDQLTLFDNDLEKVGKLEEKVLAFLNIPRKLGMTGQVYPRSLDFMVISTLLQLSSAPSSLARTLRLMAGFETGSEGFAKGQVGSSAMPHKMNSRSCERINGFHVVLSGYLHMASGISGDQWNEGDVSCSVVRRVALPDSFYTIDGLLETLLTVLDQMQIYPALVQAENEHYFPFLVTTTILMQAVKKGAGRESAHAAIKEHALSVVDDLRQGRIKENDLVDRLASDTRLGLNPAELQTILDQAGGLTGTAAAQVSQFVSQVGELVARFPAAAAYTPEPIL